MTTTTTTDDKPTFGTQEPLALTELVRQVAAQTLALLIGLHVLILSSTQVSLILAELGVLSLAATAIARSIVTPSSRVALTKDQAKLIAAVTPSTTPITVPVTVTAEAAPVDADTTITTPPEV